MRKLWLFLPLLLFGFGALALFGARNAQPEPQIVSGAVQITHGPIVGAVTDTQATVWMRTAADAETPIIAVATLDGKPIVRAPFARAGSDTNEDHTWKARLENLKPNTSYGVEIAAATGGGEARLALPAGVPSRFKTFVTPGTEASFKFAVLTDFANGATENVKTFESLASESTAPSFVIIGGDLWHRNVAPIAQNAAEFIDLQRQQFKERFSPSTPSGASNGFAKSILPSYALIHFFDDHDLGNNKTNKNFAYKQEALSVLKEFFPVYPVTSYGDWQRFSYGQADFFVLDARSQRDRVGEPDSAGKSMLNGDNLTGEGDQYEWLVDGLESSTAKWKFIVSPVVFNRTHEKRDAWWGYQSEQKKLVQFINSNHISGVVVLSGDSHVGSMDNGKNSYFPEMLVPNASMDGCKFTGAHEVGNWTNGIYGQWELKGQAPNCSGYGEVSLLTNPDRVLMTVKDQYGHVQLDYRACLNPAECNQALLDAASAGQ